MTNGHCLCKKKNCPRHGNCTACRAYHADSERKRAVACERGHGKPLYKTLLLIFACLALMQCFFLIVKTLVFSFTAEMLFSRSMVTMLSMLVLLAVLLFISRRKSYALSLFPARFRVLYIISTVLAATFYAVTLFFVRTFSIEHALMLFYGSIVTPVFEELLFRGAVWNRLNRHFKKEWQTYLTVTALFALWHIGYAVGIYLWSRGNLLNCIAMKVMVGAFFGLLTGAVRWKTKNCYCGILIHGVLNAFG